MVPEQNPQIAVLLALFRSERFLDAQLASLAAQSHENWQLITSDDSPGGRFAASEAALDALQRAQPGQKITRRIGAGRGFAANFLSLLQAVPQDCTYAALSDHDDVWLEDRLARGLALLQAAEATAPSLPLLYCAPTLICDEDLRVIGRSSRFRRPASFRNALVQSIGGGNTMMLNRAALDLVQAAAAGALAADPSGPVAHDWWLYQIVTGCGGQVVRDTNPVLYYRQHSANAIGANQALKARLARIGAILAGRFRRWNRQNLAVLSASEARFLPQARQDLAFYAEAVRGPGLLKRLHSLRRSGVYRQSWRGTAALFLACVLGRM